METHAGLLYTVGRYLSESHKTRLGAFTRPKGLSAKKKAKRLTAKASKRRNRR